MICLEEGLLRNEKRLICFLRKGVSFYLCFSLIIKVNFFMNTHTQNLIMKGNDACVYAISQVILTYFQGVKHNQLTINRLQAN